MQVQVESAGPARDRFETAGSELAAPSGGRDILEEPSEDVRENSTTRLDATQASQSTDSCLPSVIANLPGGSALALGLLCGGIILLVTGFFLTRQEFGSYVRQHQQPKSDVTFDKMSVWLMTDAEYRRIRCRHMWSTFWFPSLLYWIVGLAAGLLAYGLLHCTVNVLVKIRVKRCSRNRKSSAPVEIEFCLRAGVFAISLADTLLVATVGLMACAAFLPLYAQAMFAVRLTHGEAQFDLGHYLPTQLAEGSSLIVESPASTGASVSASSFPMFYPSLALFVGVCFIEISLIMSLTFLAADYAQLASSVRNRRVQSSSINSFETGSNGRRGLDTQL